MGGKNKEGREDRHYGGARGGMKREGWGAASGRKERERDGLKKEHKGKQE